MEQGLVDQIHTLLRRILRRIAGEHEEAQMLPNPIKRGNLNSPADPGRVAGQFRGAYLVLGFGAPCSEGGARRAPVRALASRSL